MHSSDIESIYDVLVIGSGAAGLAAALAAVKRGKKVALLEASSHIGGTSVFSGGQAWIPNHHYSELVKIADSPKDAADYLRACSPNRTTENDEQRRLAFVENAPKMLRFIEENTPLSFAPNAYPDVFAEWVGGRAGGRNVEAVPFNPGDIHGKRKLLRYPPSINRFNAPLTWTELHSLLGSPFRTLIKLMPVILSRWMQGKISGSRALIAGLFSGCIESGVEFFVNTPAKKLTIVDGTIRGVTAYRNDIPVEIRANDGVILACGGFDWNDELKQTFLPGKIEFPACIHSNIGDGLLMAMAAGAKTEHLDEAWYWAGFRDSNYFYQGAPLGSLLSNLRAYPHTIIVNKQGRRFGNEATLNFGYAMQECDENGNLKNLPCWSIFDHQFRRKYNAMEARIHPLLPLPKWVKKYASIEELADDLEINLSTLKNTLTQFNENARQGLDPEFDRGEGAYDRCYGNPHSAHPNLGTVEKAPFYAVEVKTTSLSTKGGPVVNSKSQVVHKDGDALQKLYAIGNVADCIMYYGCSGGDSLGPGMTAGYIAGNAIGST